MSASAIVAEWWSWYVETTLVASVLIVLLATLLRCARDVLSPSWRHALWLLIALRLVLPAPLEAPWGIVSIDDGTFLIEPPAASRSKPFLADTSAGLERGVRQGEIVERDPSRSTSSSAMERLRGGGEMEARIAHPAEVPWQAIAYIAWLSGVALVLVRFALSALRLHREIARLPESRDPTILRAMACAASRLRTSALPVIESDRIPGPALVGVLRPRVVLPTTRERTTESDLRAVFLHELSHRTRRDSIFEWCFAFVAALHWPNPLVWWASRAARDERELACDARALRACRDAAERIDYGRTLLRFLAAAPRALPHGATGMWSTRSLAERRIRMISREPRFRLARWIALPMVIVLMLVGFTRAEEDPEAERDREREWIVYSLEGILVPDYAAPRPETRPPDEADDDDPALIPLDRSSPDREGSEASAHRLAELEALVRDALGDMDLLRHTEIRLDEEVETLAVHGDSRVHDEVVRILQDVRGDRSSLVRLEARLQLVDPAKWDELPQPLARKLRIGRFHHFRRDVVRLSEKEVKDLSAPASSTLISSPRVTGWDRQRCTAVIVEQESIIADLKISDSNGERSLEPVVGVVNKGVSLEILASIGDDREHVALDVRFRWTDEKNPPRSVRASSLDRFRGIDGAEDYTIQIPDIAVSGLDTTLISRSGEWVVAGEVEPPGDAIDAFGDARDDDTRMGLLFVRAIVVESGDEGIPEE